MHTVLKFFFFSVLTCSVSACMATDWSKPGSNPFMLDVVESVDTYPELPRETREAIKQKMLTREPSDMVEITKASITGQGGLVYTNLRDMHWGSRKDPHLGLVDRSSWGNKDVQRAFVYCVSNSCIIVPFVCRNVALVDLVTSTEASPPVKQEDIKPVDVVEQESSFASQSDQELIAVSGSDSYIPTGWVKSPYVFVSTPQFTGGGVGLIGNASGNIAVSPIPEPETWVLSMAGLMMVALKLRKNHGKS